MSYDPNTPSQPSYPPPPQNYGGDPAAQGFGNQGAGNPGAVNQQGYQNAPAYGDPGGYPGSQPQAGNGLAIASLVCGIVGLLVANIILGPLAIIFGVIGLQRANKGAKFKGLAIAGIILGAIDVLLFIIAIAFLSSNGFTY